MKNFCIFGLIGSLALIVISGAARAETGEFDKGMSPVLNEYLKIQHSLAASSLDGVTDAAKSIEVAANQIDVSRLTMEEAEKLAALPSRIAVSASALSKAESLDAVRFIFRELSAALVTWAKTNKPVGVRAIYCSMVKANWLQVEPDVRNPYFGPGKMLTCGIVEK